MSKPTALDAATRETTVREWVRRKLGSIAHEQRVARVARTLFNLTAPWHEMGVAEGRLLALACLVHDVGRAEQDKGHARIGARLIQENLNLPLQTEAERRRLAFLTRYHRGTVPDAGSETLLHRELDDVRALRIILGLLRAADGLDSRSLPGPQLVATKHARTVTIFGYVAASHSAATERLGRPKKFRLLEETLRCQVRAQWHLSDQLAMVS